MLHIISQFLEKQNPVHLLLRIGLCYSGSLAVLAIILIRFGVQNSLYFDRRVEVVLVAAITAFLQTLIGAWFLFKMKKTSSK